MKRILSLVVLIALAAAAATASDVDLVVVMDTSESMFPYFEDLRDFLLRDLLKEKLHRGDTFHLLSFSSSPELEIALPITDERAAERSFGRLALLHPLGRYTDLVAALRFVHQYVRQLPEGNAKTLLILTDGIHDPPPGSPNRLAAAEVAAAVRASGEAMRREGWTVQVLQVPPEPSAADVANGLPSYLGDLGAGLGVAAISYDPARRAEVTGILTGFPAISFPEPLGEVARRFTLPLRVRNFSKDPILVRLSGAEIDHVAVLERPVEIAVPANATVVLAARLRLPLSFPTGPQERLLVLDLPAELRISPLEGTISFSYTGRGSLNLPRFSLLYVVYLLMAGAAVYVLVRLFLLMRRKLHETSLAGIVKSAAVEPRRAPAAPAAGLARRSRVPLMEAGTRRPAAAAVSAVRMVRPTPASLRRSLPRVGSAPSGLPPLIEMRVSQQNSRVGFRNVHRILANTARSVGGGSSPFLVFITRIPRAVAEIRNEDGEYTFVPLRGEFFPDVAGPVKHCLGREIPVTGSKGRRHTLVFREWVSALDEINALMRSVRRE